ncbi:MAG: glycerate kinase, partial [Clostridia bacterium]|nr:glycerate kinase [Clostridia bacterium]
MKVVIAMDSFKGSLTSIQAGNAVQQAVLRLKKDATVVIKPLADGGEGTVDALASVPGAQRVEQTVMGPLQKPVQAQYCILNGQKAVIEMAAA